MKPSVHIVIPTFEPRDAVGNDAFGMYQVLRQAGYPVKIFSQTINPSYSAIAEPMAPPASGLFRDRRAVMIYHHATDWPIGEQIFGESQNKKVIKYHNVTPAEFFSGYAENYYQGCRNGAAATGRLARVDNTWIWGDSQFNTDEFIARGADVARCRVIAPLHQVKELLDCPLDPAVIGKYREIPVRILFVGAFRPNKGHMRAIEVLAAYHRLSRQNVKLFLVGSANAAMQGYVREIHQYADAMGVHHRVVFAHSVNASQLRSYYSTSTLFLCVSEHEGFCVPLIESMAFRLPIAAVTKTAVGETGGGCGLFLDDYEPEHFARAIDDIVENPMLAQDLAERGRMRYEAHFTNQRIGERLLKLMREVEGE